jgi:hypothetical protein
MCGGTGRKSSLGIGKTGPVTEIPTLPDSAASRAAVEVATAYHSPALLHHCVRSYLWAAWYGQRNGIGFDAELLCVASMLHDLGLAAQFDSHTVPFELAGGHVAWVFGAGAGWPVDRRIRAGEIIERHMWDAVDPVADPEGHLLELSTGLDISGRNPDRWPAELRRVVVDRYPRLGLAGEFVACFEDQARRKPTSSAATAVRNGIAARIAGNVLDHAG